MALDYMLAVIGRTTPDAMAERLGFPRQDFVIKRGLWTTRQADRLFILTLHRAEHGYFEHEAWVRKPKEYLSVGFRLDKFRSDEAMRVLHKLVARALASGDEDMLFLGPDDFLRFERVNGRVRRRRQLTS